MEHYFKEPSLVLPYLYVGGEVDVTNEHSFRLHGFTDVINVTPDVPQTIGDDHFLRLPWRDDYKQTLRQSDLSDAFKFIEERGRFGGGVVLVHCKAGISRSPALVLAYLMLKLGYNMEEGMEKVTTVRPIASPNFHFLGQLLNMERNK